MAVTIKDIARETNLSISTISKYLNHEKILEANRLLIEEAIQRLDYHPNRNAQILRAKQTKTVAILISDLSDYFWSNTIASITRFLSKLDYMVFTQSYYGDQEKEEELMKSLIAKRVDGVILFPIWPEDVSYHLLQDAGIPVVMMDQRPTKTAEYPVDCVRSDNEGGGRIIGDYLLENGHRRIGVLCPLKDCSTDKERVAGLRQACEKRPGVQILNAGPICTNGKLMDVMVQSGEKFTEMMSSPDPPTAVFCVNYTIAMGVLMKASERNLAIPEDLSLITFDNDLLFQSVTPPVTCVAQDLRAIGEEASRILLRRMSGDTEEFPLEQTVAVHFLERASVRKLQRETEPETMFDP